MYYFKDRVSTMLYLYLQYQLLTLYALFNLASNRSVLWKNIFAFAHFQSLFFKVKL